MLNFILISIAATAGLSADQLVIVDEQPIIRVNLADYDLSRAGEKRRLDQRIVRAADRVCNATIPGAVQIELFACTRYAIANARNQLDTILAQHRSSSALIGAITVTATNK